MSEERLQEIKDSVNFQREILLAHNMGTLCVDEEQELIEEIERLHSIIKEVREYIEENQVEHRFTDRGGFTYTEGHFLRDSDTLLEILDKENN